MSNCLACDTPLAESIAKIQMIHPSCRMADESRPDADEQLRTNVLNIINYADRNSARSKQTALGPSDLGHPCDRRIAYGLAAMERVNFRSDPWAAIMGTAMHGWLEMAVGQYQKEVNDLGWVTESELQIDNVVLGHTDVWVEPDVVDWKSISQERLKKVIKDGVPEYYQIQGQLYGLGHHRLGRSVRDIVLVFLPRDGRLRDVHIYREKFDRVLAERVLKRMYDIAGLAIRLDVLSHPERWNEIPAQPSRSECWYCPFFQERDAERTADATGCPGYSEPAEQRAAKAVERFWK